MKLLLAKFNAVKDEKMCVFREIESEYNSWDDANRNLLRDTSDYKRHEVIKKIHKCFDNNSLSAHETWYSAMTKDLDGFTYIRREASTSSSVIEIVFSGEKFEIIQHATVDTNWHFIKLENGKSGWIHNSRVTILEDYMSDAE